MGETFAFLEKFVILSNNNPDAAALAQSFAEREKREKKIWWFQFFCLSLYR